MSWEPLGHYFPVNSTSQKVSRFPTLFMLAVSIARKRLKFRLGFYFEWSEPVWNDDIPENQCGILAPGNWDRETIVDGNFLQAGNLYQCEVFISGKLGSHYQRQELIHREVFISGKLLSVEISLSPGIIKSKFLKILARSAGQTWRLSELGRALSSIIPIVKCRRGYTAKVVQVKLRERSQELMLTPRGSWFLITGNFWL